MAKVVSLFESQEEATKALDALYASSYESVDAEVIENVSELDYGETGVVAPAPNASTGVAGAVDIPGPLQDTDLDEEEAAWFARGVQGGSVLVVAEVDEEDADAVQQLFYEHGGRTYEKA